MEIKGSQMKMIFILVAAVSIVIFLLAGYLYPATEKDIASNSAFPFNSNGKYDRGLFTQFFTSLVFTAGVLLLVFYVVSTFVAYGMKHWNTFSLGIYLMFLYGLGKIGELTFSKELFDALKDLLLPLALIVMAYGTYQVYSDFRGGNKNVDK